VERLHRTWHELALLGHPLLTAPFISESLGTMLTDNGWSWADHQGNFDLRAPGMVLRQRRSNLPPAVRRITLPKGSWSLAIIRSLVRSGVGDPVPRVTALARIAGVSQPRASQVLGQLHDLGLVESAGHGRWEPRKNWSIVSSRSTRGQVARNRTSIVLIPLLRQLFALRAQVVRTSRWWHRLMSDRT
jgi:hypothetical protein